MDARTEKYEPILLIRMVWIRYKSAELVCKGGFGLVKRDVMLLAISGILARIPVKGKMAHALHCSYTVRIVKAPCQILLTPNSTAAEGGRLQLLVSAAGLPKHEIVNLVFGHHTEAMPLVE